MSGYPIIEWSPYFYSLFSAVYSPRSIQTILHWSFCWSNALAKYWQVHNKVIRQCQLNSRQLISAWSWSLFVGVAAHTTTLTELNWTGFCALAKIQKIFNFFALFLIIGQWVLMAASKKKKEMMTIKNKNEETIWYLALPGQHWVQWPNSERSGAPLINLFVVMSAKSSEVTSYVTSCAHLILHFSLSLSHSHHFISYILASNVQSVTNKHQLKWQRPFQPPKQCQQQQQGDQKWSTYLFS